MSSQVRCPWCNTQGVNQIGSYLLQPAVITYCRKCMAIRGVIPLIFPPPSHPGEISLRCPWCNASKIEQVKITPLGKRWLLISCRGCDAIHGLIPLVEPKSEDNLSKPDSYSEKELTPSTGSIATADSLRDKQLWMEIGQADLEAKRAQYEIEMQRRTMTAKKGGSMYRAIVEDQGPPYCMQCRKDMVSQVVPPGYKNSGKKVWICPNECGKWEAG